MIQDIYPKVYSNAFTPRAPKEGDKLFCFSEKGLLAKQAEDGTVLLPPCENAEARYLFSIDGCAYFLHLGTPIEETNGFSCVSSRLLRDYTPSADLFACAVAESLHRWYSQNVFCGVCGGKMRPGETERSLVCESCGQTIYPKICPAVIVAVTDGDRLLLTKYRGRPFRRYALIAGFNEIGEGIEDTVRREVMEETGLRVKKLRFYKSQPWVYTDSLLMGFFADLDGADDIHIQEDELSEAGWFSRDNIPEDHSAISLTGEMIELFRCGGEPK